MDDKNFKLLDDLDLAEYFITSKAEKILSKKAGEILIEVTKSKGTKCPRCWKILDHSCNRCKNAMKE